MGDLVNKYLPDTGPNKAKKDIDAAKKKYQTQDPKDFKHGLRGVMDKMGWEDNPDYKKAARPPEQKNPGRGVTKD